MGDKGGFVVGGYVRVLTAALVLEQLAFSIMVFNSIGANLSLLFN